MALDDSLLTSTGQGVNPFEATLDQWNNETIKLLQKSLDEKASTGTSQALRQSIEPQAIKTTDNGLSVEIVMEDYYKYIDQGVQGVGGEKKGGGIFEQVAPNSPFSYKEGNKPSAEHFKQWALTKNLNPFAVRESVFRKGITPNHFYSDVMTEQWIDVLVDRLEKVGAGAVEILIVNSIENGNNN
jgi:hypothetical protein